ncbi:serpin family protein [Streptacidiphilus rugosus]|uniref:serpin family protein n=1 Tax=Streptacidiphilus rugosus TaxID=405783 RepID=UPI00055C2B0F|nr:serpin family protein [Streptacidiphilus rugosus]
MAAQATTAQLVGEIQRFAARLLTGVVEDAAPRAASGDFTCAPVGLWLALSALASGAGSETARELRDLLGAAGPEAASAATAATEQLALTDGVAVATAVWSRTPVYREYRERLPDVAFGHLDPADVSAIDRWVWGATEGMIHQLPDPPEPDELLLLVNALQLDGTWSSRFKQEKTADRAFTDALGVEHLVPTMATSLPRPAYAWTVEAPSGNPDEDVEVVALLCSAEPDRLPLQVSCVLGAPGRGPAEVLPAAWAAHERRRPIDADAVTITLPQLHLETHLRVEELLPSLGAPLAVSDRADFSGMSPEALRLGRLTQESVLRIDEKGVRAAAVTQSWTRTLGVSGRVPRTRHIAFDRPFGLVVFAGSTGLPLFTAWQASAPRSPHRHD